MTSTAKTLLSRLAVATILLALALGGFAVGWLTSDGVSTTAGKPPAEEFTREPTASESPSSTDNPSPISAVRTFDDSEFVTSDDVAETEPGECGSVAWREEVSAIPTGQSLEFDFEGPPNGVVVTGISIRVISSKPLLGTTLTSCLGDEGAYPRMTPVSQNETGVTYAVMQIRDKDSVDTTYLGLGSSSTGETLSHVVGTGSAPVVVANVEVSSNRVVTWQAIVEYEENGEQHREEVGRPTTTAGRPGGPVIVPDNDEWVTARRYPSLYEIVADSVAFPRGLTSIPTYYTEETRARTEAIVERLTRVCTSRIDLLYVLESSLGAPLLSYEGGQSDATGGYCAYALPNDQAAYLSAYQTITTNSTLISWRMQGYYLLHPDLKESLGVSEIAYMTRSDDAANLAFVLSDMRVEIAAPKSLLTREEAIDIAYRLAEALRSAE
jgi:hypothetical protein